MTKTTEREQLQGSNFTLVKEHSITFDKPTDILVIDPCYVCTHSKPDLDKFWSEFCEKMFSDKGTSLGVDNTGVLEFRGAKMLYSGTAYGDGSYPVRSSLEQKGNEAGVDAGMLCVLSLEDAKKINPDESDWNDSGVIVRGYAGTIEADRQGNFEGDNSFSVDTEGSNDEEE